MGATPCLLHPSCFRKKAGSSGRFPQGAQSAKKGLGTNGITTSVHCCHLAAGPRASGKTRVGSDFQLSTGLFSTLAAGRVGAGLWPAGRQKPLKTVKNMTQTPAPKPEYGLSDPIGASRNASFVQRDESGYSGITTSRLPATGPAGALEKTLIIHQIFINRSYLRPPILREGRSEAIISPPFGRGRGEGL